MAPTAQLGRAGPRVPAQGFGLMGLSAFAGDNLPDSQRLAVLDRAHALGATFWDSSDIYGDSEELVGRWLQRTGKRSSIFLATKFGGLVGPDGQWTCRNDLAYVRQACEASLRRLGVEHIDLYYAHRLDGVTPIEHMVEAMVQLKREGKIRHLGLSEVSADSLRRAHAVHPIAAVQVEYSPFTLDIEHPSTPLLAACRELGVAVVAYSPLSRGLLTGAIRSPGDFEEGDLRKFFPRFSAENFPKNLDVVRELESIAADKGCTSGQLSLAWLAAQSRPDSAVIPLPGTRRVKYLEENWGALELALSAEDISRIRAVVEAAAISGHRYPEALALGLLADSPPLPKAPQ